MIYFRKSPDPMGDYVDAAGNRFSIAAARRIRTYKGVNVGYEAFESLADALTEWKLAELPMEQEVAK